MDNTLYIALSRQTSLWRKLDMVSNNIANVNTTAYKGMQPHFSEYVSKSKNDESLMSDKLSFVHDFGLVRNFSEGAFKATGNPLDVAIHGDGYFAVDTSEGLRYTRNGQFKINPDGMLVTSRGEAVLDTANQPIFFAPEETQVYITRDGVISTENGNIATLQMVSFLDQQKLRETHSGLYRNTEGNVMNFVTPNVEQGMLEASNINAVVEMTEMIKLQRAYENVQMMIDSEHSRRQNAMQVFTRSGSN